MICDLPVDEAIVSSIESAGYIVAPVVSVAGRKNAYLVWFESAASEMAYLASRGRSCSEPSERLSVGVEKALSLAKEHGYRGVSAYYGDRPMNELIDCHLRKRGA